ncbi:ribosome recycling factor [Patellaria atrata CBS 101060]|uniref:Ribosome recycling factor n=1 Tax=Patellaria atrata CBS 101060 TaxID=1346257 RepID=A0A9P4SFP9_9PEZI|nr:ribosome recycling factor [Patellaria atrata CBS 101060]
MSRATVLPRWAAIAAQARPRAPTSYPALNSSPQSLPPPFLLPCLQPSPSRTFTTTPLHQKKAGKVNRSYAATDSTPPVPADANPTPTDDAFDLSPLESSILKAIEKLTHDLSELRSGGRFNPTLVENLRVSIPSANNNSGKELIKLMDLAQVIPKGRVLNVVVGEKEHLKPVSTAIASSQYSLVPQMPSSSSSPATSSDPLTLTVPIPPPTGESRQAALDKAAKTAESANRAIRDARSVHQKRLRRMFAERKVRPDDLQKAQKMMEEVVKRGNKEVERIVDGAKKVLAQ